MNIMYDEPTCYVAVFGEGTNQFINGKMHVRKKSYRIRDASKLKWAPGCKHDENSDDLNDMKKGDPRKSRQRDLGYSNEDLLFGTHRRKRKIQLGSDEEEEYYDEEYFDENIPELSVEDLLLALSQFDLGGSSIFSKATNLKKFDANTKVFIYQKLTELEKSQLIQWLTALRNMILTHQELQKLKYREEMENFCNTIFEKMTNPLSKFAHCIVGPRYSGKSTFLAVLVAKIGERLSMNGQWRKSFFFFLDFKNASKSFTNISEIFKIFVRATFKQAEVQIPNFSPFTKKCISFFCGIPSNQNSTTFPKRVAIDKVFEYADIRMTKLAEKAQMLLNNKSKFFETLDFIFNFPKEIARIFNLPEVTYILDNFDECDVDLYNPYAKNKKEQHIFIIERFKRLLPTVSFVLSCLELPHFLNILGSIQKESINMKTQVQIVNIADLPIKKPESNFEILVRYDDDHTSIRLTRDCCKSCVGLIVGWDRLIKLGTIVENNNMLESKIALKKKKEMKITQDDVRMLEYARHFLPKVMTYEQIPKTNISYVSLVDPRL